jgi:iron complex outermembrane receptor protein
VSLGVDNLFNKTYSEHLNLAGNAGFGYAANTAVNEPGRTVWARVSFKY